MLLFYEKFGNMASSMGLITNGKHSFGLVFFTTVSTIGLGWYLYSKKKDWKNQGKESSTNGSGNGPVLQRQFYQASQLAAGLKNMTNGDRLMIYGLYKQATDGDRKGNAPSSFQVVANAKYSAWGKFTGMDKETAMMKYCEMIQHFSTGGKSIFAPDDDKADIIYPDEDSDEDLSSDDEGNKNQPISGFGKRQSTMAEIGPDGVLLRDQGITSSEESNKYEKEMPLHDYASKGDVVLLQKALENGGDVNKTDESGQTALHFAADKGHVDCISSLISAGADVNASDVDGISVLQSSVIGEHREIAQLLLQAGANPDKKDDDGDSARSSIDSDDDEMIQLFKKF